MYNKPLAKRLTILIPFIAIILYYISDDVRLLMNTYLPPCLIFSNFHVYCPACGNTRSVTALLHGDILSSLRFNIVPIILIVFAALAYIELVSFSFGKKTFHLLPRKLSFYLLIIALIFLYFIVRNFIPYLTP